MDSLFNEARLFQSTLPARGATSTAVGFRSQQRFQSTLPARGATFLRPPTAFSPNHFNPRSPHGERRASFTDTQSFTAFQSTLPARGATRLVALILADGVISIHAPRTGSDVRHVSSVVSPQFQSTLPARGATQAYRDAPEYIQFQSTLPARGATRRCPPAQSPSSHFNPRSPHGERLLYLNGKAS